MHMSDSLPDKRIIVINEAGQDISLLHEDPGTEIQYTKDFGCGLDVHSKFIQVSVLVKRNLSVYEYRKDFKTDWDSLAEAKQWVFSVIRNHSQPAVDPEKHFHYCLESTSIYHCVILKAWEGTPSVINPSLARAGSKKTDILDAKTLAISDLTGIWPETYLPNQSVIELRMLVDERTRYIHRATQISNHINNSLLKLGLTSGKNGSVTKTKVIRDQVKNLLNGDPVCPASQSDSTNSIVSGLPCIPPDLLNLFSMDYAEYDYYRQAADEMFQQILSKIDSMKWETADDEISGAEMMKILTSTPGIGKQTAALWLTRVVTPRRFKNEKALAAYCGCDPSLKVSAGKVTSTVKRGGRKDIHSALCQAASNLMRLHSEPFGRFGYNIAMQTGVWKKGVSALARKLAVAMYFMSLHREMFSYEKYKLVSDPDVINMSIEELAAINPAFRRYIRYLINSGITDTKILAHQYAICGLPSIKGLGKNFFALVKDFINEQDTYKKSYERMQSNAENRFENQSPGNE